MTIPKEIVDKMKQINALMAEIDWWMDNNIDVDGSRHSSRELFTGKYVHFDYYQFTDEARGEEQDDGEYCYQWAVGESGDNFHGVYYYPTDDGEYFYFEFWI